MQLDPYTVALLIRKDDAPVLDDHAAARLQDEHMAHLADLYDAGTIVAVGPLLDDSLRGLIILSVEVEQAKKFLLADPAVRAGRFSVQVMPWLVPAGIIEFRRGKIPRSSSEVG